MQGIEIVGPDGQSANPMVFPTPCIKDAVLQRAPVMGVGQSVDILRSSSGNIYEVGRRLRESIYGEVRFGVILCGESGTLARTNNSVAIKVYLKIRLTQYAGRTQENPYKEIAAMQFLKQNGQCHPNIVNLIECLQDDKCVYSVLEYYDGGELFDQLDDGALPEHQVHAYFSHVLQ
eukprot:gene12798-26982_t